MNVRWVCLLVRILGLAAAVVISPSVGKFAAFGQASKATASLTGRVSDPSDNLLQSAGILVEPVGLRAYTNAQGVYFINDLAPGHYTLVFSYVGFADQAKTVDVAAGAALRVDAHLELQSATQRVLVTAERAEGEAAAVNQELGAPNIVQVLPANVIRSLPNANLADAIGRLPSVTLERDEGEGKYIQVRGTEPRLTNVTVDGVNTPSPEAGVRQIKLDTIPADLVDSVEINKTLQANMDGDGIGGSVNLVTKTAAERPILVLGEMGGYTPIIGGRGLDESTATVGNRFGASHQLGVLVGASYDWNGRGIDDVEPVPDVATNLAGQPRWFDSVDQREYEYYRSRYGVAGSADYKVGRDSTIYLRGLFSDFKNYGDRWVYTLNDNSSGVVTYNGCNTGGSTTSCGGNVPSFNTSIRRPDYMVSSMILGGHHVLMNTWYAWEVSVARSRQIERGDPQATFTATNLSSSSCGFDPSATKSLYLPQWSPACYTEAYNPANFTLTDFQTESPGLTAQLNLQASGDMAYRYHLGSHLATLQYGGKLRTAHKFDDGTRLDFTPTGSVSMSQFPSVFSNSNYYGGAYNLGPNPSYWAVLAYFKGNQGAFTPNPDTSGQFDLVEQVGAGYVMNTFDFSRFVINAGVRVENTNLDTLSYDVAAGTLSDHANGSYIKVLPSASVRYLFTGDTDLRLSYGRGLARPDPQDIAQAVSYTTAQTPYTASLGNPNLRAETANSYDIVLEHALKPYGIFSVGYFYKDLSDPIVTTTQLIQNYQPTPQAPKGTYDVTQPVNAGSAWVSGFEASYIQHLGFLPGYLAGLGLSANYSYTASEADGIPNRADMPRLLRDAPNTWNISPTYDRGRFSVRVGMAYNGANIYSYQYTSTTPGGLNGPLGDVYFYPHFQVDAQGSIGMGHGLTFVMYGLDLNNEVFGFYNGGPQYMIQREFYRPTVAAGFRWSPFAEHP